MLANGVLWRPAGRAPDRVHDAARRPIWSSRSAGGCRCSCCARRSSSRTSGSATRCWASRVPATPSAARDALGVVRRAADRRSRSAPMRRRWRCRIGRIVVAPAGASGPMHPRGARAARERSPTPRCGAGSASRPACRGSRPRRRTCSCRRRRTGTCSAASVSRRAAIRARKSSRACNISGGSRSGCSRSAPKRTTSPPATRLLFGDVRRRPGVRHRRQRRAAIRRAAACCSRSCRLRPLSRQRRPRSAHPTGPLLRSLALPYAVPDAAAPRAPRMA